METLGHCGECHSPRGALGQVDRDRPLGGNSELGRFAAPDITPQGLAARGWAGASLREYLATGSSALAVASDEMLQRGKPVDEPAQRPGPRCDDYLPARRRAAGTGHAGQCEAAASADAVGQRHYFDLCAGCHGRDGGGVPNVAVSLRANSSVRDSSPHNLIVAVLDGLPEHDFPGLARMQDMPGFAADLDDAEVAVLATWLRQRFGGQSAPVDVESVRELRR